ncbi:MAG: hypothetical protein ACK2TZ_11485 [Anaerolineales bacterium]
MKESLDLKDIRRQVFLYYAEDGLVDIAVGLVILGFGLLLLLDFPALVSLLGLLALSVWYLGKGSLVIPRVGSIKPGREMKDRFKSFFITLILLGAGVFTLFLAAGAGGGGSLFARYSLSLFGLVVALGISSLGLVLDTARFYYYGVLVFLAMAGGNLLSQSVTAFDPFLAAVISAGGLITVAGTVTLIRFLAKYPVIRKEA